jgi:hypothetical protein
MRDVLHFGMKSMVVGGATSIQVARVAEVRRRHQPLISWSAILIKAIALVAKDLRRAYMPFPWAHLYEHPHNVATVVLEREWHNAPAVFFDQIQQPEKNHCVKLIRGRKLKPLVAIVVLYVLRDIHSFYGDCCGVLGYRGQEGSGQNTSGHLLSTAWFLEEYLRLRVRLRSR